MTIICAFPMNQLIAWFVINQSSFENKLHLHSIFKEMSFELLKNTFKNMNIREKFQNLQKEWPHKSPKEKWIVLCDIPRVLLAIFGIRILEDCRVYWLSFFGSFLALNYFVLVVYTLIYFGKDGRFIYGTRCLAGCGIVSTVIITIFIWYFK